MQVPPRAGVRLPHIAGRTSDANFAVADIIANDFLRVFRGEEPRHLLARERHRVQADY